jgi:phenylalanyl-tRNA synthetase beta subunit
MAYQVTYQSIDHSLSEQEVAQVRRRIIETVVRETGAKLRG